MYVCTCSHDVGIAITTPHQVDLKKKHAEVCLAQLYIRKLSTNSPHPPKSMHRNFWW